MAEITYEKAKNLAEIFLQVYNKEENSSYYFYIFDEKNQNEWDFICKNNLNEILKIQVIEGISMRGKELVQQKKFERGQIETTTPLHLQSPELIVEEALGRKMQNYDSKINKDLIVLINFALFPYNKEDLPKMKDEASEYKNKFKGVYVIHEGKQLCDKLFKFY